MTKWVLPIGLFELSIKLTFICRESQHSALAQFLNGDITKSLDPPISGTSKQWKHSRADASWPGDYAEFDIQEESEIITMSLYGTPSNSAFRLMWSNIKAFFVTRSSSIQNLTIYIGGDGYGSDVQNTFEPGILKTILESDTIQFSHKDGASLRHVWVV